MRIYCLISILALAGYPCLAQDASGKIVGTLYPILTYRSGFPLDVLAFAPGTASSVSSPGPSGACDIQVVRADLVAPVQYENAGLYRTVNSISAGSQSGNYWFNPNSFSNAREVALNQEALIDPAALVNQFTYGTFGRNALRGPGAFNFNLSLSKVFRVREKLNMELRADAFNLFNTVEFGNPDTNSGDQSFGQISTTADPRIIQLALHLQF